MILNNLKAISATEDDFVVANYIVLFGGRDLEWVKRGPNPDGSMGEFFTKSTALESSYTEAGMLYMDWEHGYGKELDGPEAPNKDDVLGYVDWKTARKDDRGWWVERVLSRRNKYVKFLEELIRAGMIGTSSEPVQKSVVKGKDGEIKSWPLKRDTLTAEPAEPRMMTDNVVIALKHLSGKLKLPEVSADGLPTLAQKAGQLSEAMQELVSNTKGLVDGIDRPLTEKKRAELQNLLEQCSRLDAVRTDLKSVLAVPVDLPNVEAARLRYEMRERRQRLAHILGD
jgi:hypothetical protein